MLPAGLTWTVGGANAADCLPASPIAGGTTLTCDFGTLAQGATATITLTAPTTTPDCGTIPNTVTISATGDITPLNNEDDGLINVRCGALEITKTAKHAGLGSADLTGTFNVVDAAGNSHELEVTNGVGCIDGIAIGTASIAEDPADFPGYAVPDIADVNVAAGTCDDTTGTLAEGGTLVEVDIVPLTDITWSVDSQHTGATSTTVNCKDAAGVSCLATRSPSAAMVRTPSPTCFRQIPTSQ